MTLKLINSLFFILSITILTISIFILTPISLVQQDPQINKQFSIEKQQYGKIKEILAYSEPQLKQSIENQLTETYKNEYYGIQFEYPSTADLLETPLITMSYSQLAYIFFEGKYKLPYLTIKLYPLSLNEKTLDNFTSRFVKEKQIPGILNNSVYILNSRATDLAGKPAHELEYIEEYYGDSQNKSSSSKKIESKILSIWTINGNQAYELQFKGSNEKYDRYLPEAKIIINSFKINK